MKTAKQVSRRLPLSLAILSILGVAGCSSTDNQIVDICKVEVFDTADANAMAKEAKNVLQLCGAGFYLDHREKQIADLAKLSQYQARFERVSEDRSGAVFSRNADRDVLASQVSLIAQTPMFGSGDSEIKDAKQLANLRTFLKGYIATLDAGSSIYVVGHTDSQGAAQYNQSLSERRARFIADELVKLGFDKSRLYYEGVGESQPIANNSTDIGRAANRRFELLDVFEDKNSTPEASVARISAAKKQRIENVLNMAPIAERPKVPRNKPADGRLALGGIPAASSTVDFDAILASRSTNGLNLFSQQDGDIVATCLEVEPVYPSVLKAYLGGKVVKSPSDIASVRNLVNSTWEGKSGSTTVNVGPVDVKQSTLEVGSKPIFSFFVNHDGSKKGADYSYSMNVETYKGNNAVLLRMYPEQRNALMTCSDVIFSTNGDSVTKSAGIFYQGNRKSAQLMTELDLKLK
ncbi:OmpA family protein [Thaumasiovibrio subtropicus]|uniref:OmpA family protein n=1 Tax=Thaumasiovibrio subtropicus TaxID=1891207 RepID=UPI00192CF94B|nr:OmpA family protein [Thaumasiovibrio subtropicus]